MLFGVLLSAHSALAGGDFEECRDKEVSACYLVADGASERAGAYLGAGERELGLLRRVIVFPCLTLATATADTICGK